MRRWTARFVAVAVSLMALIALPALAADPAQQGTPAAGGSGSAPADAQAKMKAEMDAYAKLAQPGEHHKILGKLAGKWKTTGKAWMEPGQPPVEMSSTTEATWQLGGRYLQEVHTSTFMGQPFEGRGFRGYDNATHEYFTVWADSMGTGIEVFRGTCDDPCKVLTETAEGPDPMTGKVMKSKTVTTFVDPDTYRFEMYMVGAGKDGQDAKVMEGTATRQK